jgi:uncharacterized protein
VTNTAMPLPALATRRPFHLLAKPIGPRCNLDCSYCFYLKKTALYPATHSFRMSDAVLEAFIKSYLESQDTAEVMFAWQGGEPTLLGIDFFRQARALQERYAGGRRVSNSIQTNGTLLDDDWGRFLHDEQFLVGLSLDGPREIHDHHRQDRHQAGTFDRVMAGLRTLQRHAVEYNLLTVISAHNARDPRALYRFLKSTGAHHLQFIPLVERAVSDPEDVTSVPDCHQATSASVSARAWGDFLCGVFDEWVQRDVGRVFVQAFDGALASWVGQPAPLCVHAEECGRALAIEHNGDVYACDHYVYSSHRRGNVLQTPLSELVDAPDQVAFGRDKSRTLSPTCLACRWRFACQGGCPKHRFAADADGHPLNHLCAGYRQFFSHVDGPMREMAGLLQQGEAPARIMRRMRRR